MFVSVSPSLPLQGLVIGFGAYPNPGWPHLEIVASSISAIQIRSHPEFPGRHTFVGATTKGATGHPLAPRTLRPSQVLADGSLSPFSPRMPLTG